MNKYMSINMAKRCIYALLISFGITGAASADSRIFDLKIQNGMDSMLFVMLSVGGHNCYEGDVPLGTLMGPIEPGATTKITLARVQGNGCDGHQGEFEIVPVIGANEPQHMDFDNEGNLNLSNKTYSYVGTLSAKDMGTNSYTYTISKGL